MGRGPVVVVVAVAVGDRLTVAPGGAAGPHQPGSPYVMTVWLGVIGPTATLAWSMLARCATGGGGEIDAYDFARTLGVGHTGCRSSVLNRTLTRMVGFRAATWDGEGGVLRVRTGLGDVPPRLIAGLSVTARMAHTRLSEAASSGRADEIVAELSTGHGLGVA
ncbi:hypothetical protein K6U06_05815 [Acidiferrimicrobium sp. IK]|uniref:hypothetical protein n=1 Tax=Acidiferrimicrobium sp. IK TaxID=2871700 RepID=UPI0021CB67C9|nr:hypothetical protein [Acidiferrimicrobium sp. IK]MCU4183869.1 hypothetical protein [Acidiferrimicrobium sp. IK]